VATCGFGLAAAGGGAAHAIATNAEAAARGVVLVGAAGTYDERRAPLATALVAGWVRCHGIGAAGQSAAELGLGDPDLVELADAGPEIVSVAAASAGPAEAAALAGRYPAAIAEEMEGYAVALAARRFGVPLIVVRGISNRAGDRDHDGWRLAEALGAAWALVEEALAR
jgi:futalosine hydrolase